MVQVVHLAAFEKTELLPELGNVARFGVYDLRFRIGLLQKLRERLGGLLRFGKLALYEGRQLVIRQLRVSFQAVVLFILSPIIFLSCSIDQNGSIRLRISCEIG